MLDARKRQILQAVIDDYIQTAEPVASTSLIKKYDFKVSSATVRNEMADLENQGYLEQPHTSSGRIPSDKGYREYVNSLMKVSTLSSEESQEIRGQFSENFTELTELLKQASKTLANNTGYASVALTPRLQSSYLTQLKMMMIEPGKALVVVVLSAGVVKDRIVRVSDYLTAKQLADISGQIELNLCGKSLDEITLVTVALAAKETTLPDSLLNQLLYEAYVAIKQADNLDLYLEGTNKMLAFPEFNDITKARVLLDTLAKSGMIAGYLKEIGQGEGNFSGLIPPLEGQKKDSYMIRIGQEIQLEGLENCSFITTTYQMGHNIFGNIGIIGPKRMDYSKVISHISFVRNTLNQHLIQDQATASSPDDNKTN